MSKSWPAKDPDAVLDYVYRIPLDASDSIAAKANISFVKLSGSVTIDSYDIAAAPNTTSEGYGQDVTVWLSGGTDGASNVFEISWTTVATREDDDTITLLVASNDLPELALTGYAKPLPGHLILRYPAFAAVPSTTIAYWLKDAERLVGTSWFEGDYAAGLMSLAAHNMTLSGLGVEAAAIAGVPSGITSLKSGALSLNFTSEAANARLGGGYDSTRYGVEYRGLLLRNRGGPLVAPTGVVPDMCQNRLGYPW